MDARTLVARNLRRLRVAKAFSQDELALQANVERAYVGHLERGTKNPTIDTLQKLAIALDAPIGDLFEAQPNEETIPTLKPGRKAR